MWSIGLFFFNKAATTDIYTDGHTLSLHDALPIWLLSDGSLHLLVGIQSHGQGLETTLAQVAHQELGIDFDRISVRHGDSRSEEHTSELQSLMRISYAVFCLKKNNTMS